MAKPIGSLKTGGRKKGTPNKKFWGFLETLQARDIDPLDEILNELKTLSGADKVKVCLDLLPYLYAKRKPTEVIPFSIHDHIEKMTMHEVAELHHELGNRMGEGKSFNELTTGQLETYREAVDSLILKRKALDSLKDDVHS